MAKNKEPRVDLERLSVFSRVYAALSGDPEWEDLDAAARAHYEGECRELLLALDAYDRQRASERIKRGQRASSKPWPKTPRIVRLETEAGRKAAEVLLAGGTFVKAMRASGLGGQALNKVAAELRGRGHVLANSPVAPGRRAGGVSVQAEGSGAQMVRGLVEVHSPSLR